MTRGRLVVHAHFYQPSRLDPFAGRVPADPTAAPYSDWNARVHAECYRPNAERSNLTRISWNLGPTLASWMAESDPVTYGRYVAASERAIAQAYHHAILPLASARDRRTEVRWGRRDFVLRYGREPAAMWLPETAADLPTLRTLADEGIGATILAPWQADAPSLDTRRPYRVDLGDGRSLVVAFYDGALSGAVSFDPSATADADRFARDRLAPRLMLGLPDGEPSLALIASDGELYGHHQQFRDLFLQRLVAPAEDADRGFDVVDLATALTERPGHRHPTVELAARTSWSCHHGVLRWMAECPDVPDGRWKGPLRSALERLAAGIDALTERACEGLPGEPDPWAARDAYIDVVAGAETADAFAGRILGGRAATAERRRLADLMEAQRWRLAMFASDGWYWDDPIRTETKQVLRAAARAARLVDGLSGSRLERTLMDDLALFVSPGRGFDGATIYRQALAEIGQPAPRR